MNAKILSERFHDRPMTAAETAVYWTEYAIKNKGAKHMRTAVVEMPWWKYYSMDVIGFVPSITFVILCIIYFSIKTTLKQNVLKITLSKEEKKKN